MGLIRKIRVALAMRRAVKAMKYEWRVVAPDGGKAMVDVGGEKAISAPVKKPASAATVEGGNVVVGAGVGALTVGALRTLLGHKWPFSVDGDMLVAGAITAVFAWVSKFVRKHAENAK